MTDDVVFVDIIRLRTVFTGQPNSTGVTRHTLYNIDSRHEFKTANFKNFQNVQDTRVLSVIIFRVTQTISWSFCRCPQNKNVLEVHDNSPNFAGFLSARRFPRKETGALQIIPKLKMSVQGFKKPFGWFLFFVLKMNCVKFYYEFQSTLKSL